MEVTSNILPSYVLNQPTPSQLDGVSVEDEKLHRVYGCELVVQAGTILNLPQVVIVTGQNILNRFFYRKSLKRFDVFSIAMGALLLASKVEESFKMLREILFAFHHIYAKRKGLTLKPMELGGQQYTTWKNELIMIERYILKELGFSLYNIMDHPHKYILYFIKVLNGSEALANEAWRYLNDSMRLDVSLKYEAQTIACAAIYLAARKVDFALPEDASSGVWWEVFGAETADMDHICSDILSLYSYNKICWLEPLAEVDYLSPETCAAFDKELMVEAEPAAASGASSNGTQPVETLANTLQPFETKSSGARNKASGDSTPVGDGSCTPVGSAQDNVGTPVRAGGADGGGKLARKWLSVVGDIDQLDDSAAASTNKAALPLPQGQTGRENASTKSSRFGDDLQSSRGKERPSSSTRDHSKNKVSARSSSRASEPRAGERRYRDDSRDRRDRDRDRSDRGYPRKDDRNDDRRCEDSRRPRPRSNSRDRRDGGDRNDRSYDRRPTGRDDYSEKDRTRGRDRDSYADRDAERSRSYRDSRPRSRSKEGSSRRDRERDSRSPKRRRP